MPQLKNNLSYKSSEKRKGVLGTLEGICADCIHATRNGRLYPNSVWEVAFNDPIVQEHFKAGGIFGQLGHPKEGQTENEEFNSIAICMPEPPKKRSDGKLVGRWDILDTPNGRILKCLCDYGYKIGISSRAEGDVDTDWDGNESVQPEGFEFKAFDAVLLPAVKEARLNLITESLDKKKGSLKKALKESIDASNDVDKAVMLRTLEDLGIDYIEPAENEGAQEDDVAVAVETDDAASSGADLVDDLQSALKEISDLKMQVIDLNEKISVGEAKEMRLLNQINKLQIALKTERDSAKRTDAMKSQIGTMKSQIDDMSLERSRSEKLAESYKTKLISVRSEMNNLKEAAKVSDSKIKALQSKVKELQESSQSSKRKDQDLIESLQNEIVELKRDSQLKHSQYTQKLKESKEQSKKYQKLAKTAVDKYIECKSDALGISPESVKSRLNESFTLLDVDNAFENLRKYNLNMSKLPFQVNNVKKVSMKENLQKQALTNPDDVVDKALMELL